MRCPLVVRSSHPIPSHTTTLHLTNTPHPTHHHTTHHITVPRPHTPHTSPNTTPHHHATHNPYSKPNTCRSSPSPISHLLTPLRPPSQVSDLDDHTSPPFEGGSEGQEQGEAEAVSEWLAYTTVLLAQAEDAVSLEGVAIADFDAEVRGMGGVEEASSSFCTCYRVKEGREGRRGGRARGREGEKREESVGERRAVCTRSPCDLGRGREGKVVKAGGGSGGILHALCAFPGGR